MWLRDCHFGLLTFFGSWLWDKRMKYKDSWECMIWLCFCHWSSLRVFSLSILCDISEPMESLLRLPEHPNSSSLSRQSSIPSQTLRSSIHSPSLHANSSNPHTGVATTRGSPFTLSVNGCFRGSTSTLVSHLINCGGWGGDGGLTKGMNIKWRMRNLTFG